MTQKEIDQLRFQIDQLRKDKIIFALESVAVSSLAFVLLLTLVSGVLPVLLGDLPVDEQFATTVLKAVVIVPVVVWVLVVISNILRFRKIKNLENQLQEK